MLNKPDKSPPLPTDQKRELPDATESSGDRDININPQIMELYSELLKAMRENVTIEEYETLEDQPIAIIRDSRGQLSLLLRNNDGSFEKLGGNRAGDIPEENVYSTFNWLKGKKIKDFIALSKYLRQAVENKGKTA